MIYYCGNCDRRVRSEDFAQDWGYRMILTCSECDATFHWDVVE